MSPSRTRAAPMSPQERRRAIVDAVVPLVLEHGPAVTTKQIADAAGIAEGTIFRVFADKRALLLATSKETVDAAGWVAELRDSVAGVADLRGKMGVAADLLVGRMTRVFAVTAALRSLPGRDEPVRCDRYGQPVLPPFVAEANRLLAEALTELVFAPHQRELALPADRAALVLRSLVLGALHPAVAAADRLTRQEIADACLRAVVAHPAAAPSGEAPGGAA